MEQRSIASSQFVGSRCPTRITSVVSWQCSQLQFGAFNEAVRQSFLRIHQDGLDPHAYLDQRCKLTLRTPAQIPVFCQPLLDVDFIVPMLATRHVTETAHPLLLKSFLNDNMPPLLCVLLGWNGGDRQGPFLHAHAHSVIVAQMTNAASAGVEG